MSLTCTWGQYVKVRKELSEIVKRYTQVCCAHVKTPGKGGITYRSSVKNLAEFVIFILVKLNILPINTLIKVGDI